MNYYSGRIIEIQLDSYKKSIFKVALEKEISWQPGQYFNAFQPLDHSHYIPLTVFPTQFIPANSRKNEISFLPFENTNWQPGTKIQISGPHGKAWQFPPTTKRLLFLNLTCHFGYLKPFIDWLNEFGHEICILTDNNSGGLPMNVEVLPISEFSEMLNWPDQILLDIHRHDLNNLEQKTGIPTFMLPSQTSALILDHFPCSGKADCGICAISPKNKTLYPCKDGPIFSISDLIRK